MLFHSAGFLFIFLPAFLISILILPKGIIRSVVLLIFSYLFYSGAEPFFVLILVASSLTDYFAALRLNAAQRLMERRLWLLLSILVNLGILAFYKYGAWLLPSISPAVQAIGIPMPHPDFFRSFILPAGISFYTFQSMSYTIDVYRGKIQPEPNLLGFCNYVAYLPQLIAGPIERFSNLRPQLLAFSQGNTSHHWTAGIDRIVLGVAQKLLIADSCGLIVDRLAEAGVRQDFVGAWTIALGFGMQIYYDFAAYCHIAIGISLMLGIRLTENFNSPYKASSIQDFWRRWHITLSAWFRDYLYIPLGGSRKGHARTFFNLLITFLLVGLWHGAGWNYVAWGAAHGILVGSYHLKKKLLPKWKLRAYVAIPLTFITVHFTWIPFRFDDTVHIVEIWHGMLGLNGFTPGVISSADLVFVMLVTLATLLIPNASERWPGRSGWLESAFVCSIAMFAVFNSPEITKFIYFQF